MSESSIELLSKITEFNELSDNLGDEDVDKALEYIVKLIARPDVASGAVGPLIVKLQALSAKFGVLATYYMHFDKGSVNTEQGRKKNAYKTMNAELDKLVMALKYIGKVN